MSLKLKVLGLGLLAVMATSAFAAMNASAVTGGHFTAATTAAHITQIEGTEAKGTSHNLAFYEINADTTTVANSKPIECTHVAYHGELTGAAATTTQSVQVRPVYKECSTGGVAPHNVPVHVPTTCKTNVFEFKSGHGGTVNVNCNITITHPNCTIVITSAQNQGLTGITYTATNEAGKTALTMKVNVKHIKGHVHSGLCVFLGTNHLFEMVGSVTVWGEDVGNNRINIAHTAT